MAVSPSQTGWWRDWANARLRATYEGTSVLDFDANDLVVTPATAFTAAVTAPAGITAPLVATTLTLPATLRTGFIDLPLHTWRIADAAATNYGLLAATAAIGSGGVGGIDASPGISRKNAGTDTTALIIYADAVVKPLLNDFTLPPDVDASAALTFKVLAAMAGTNSSATVLTLTWVAVGPGAYAAGANQGSASSAFAAVTTLVTKSYTIAAAAINAPGNHVSVSLTPDSPGTDAMHIYGMWCEYQRVTT